MTIKTILCVFGGSESELNALHAAVGLAKSYNAQIRFLHISPDPRGYVGLYGEGIMAISTVMDTIEKENHARLMAAKAHIQSYTAKQQIPLDVKDAPVHHPSAHLIHRTGMIDEILAEEGRVSDIIVIGRGIGDPNTVYDTAVVAALFNTGRPVLLLPKRGTISQAPEYKTIVLAWNGSLEASRAMYNALPLLEQSEKLYVMTAQAAGDTHDLEAESKLMAYLKTHGIHCNPIVVAQGDHTAAEALWLRTREMKADLLVMGAYGHSRLREMILGGLTNFMLEKADIPILLSH